MASAYLDKITALLKEHGASLDRTKKHKVWRFPDGRIWVVAGTPRSDNSYKNNYYDLCNFLGIGLARHKNPNRAPKKGIARLERFREVAESGPRDFATALASIKRYVRPVPCPNGSAWLERLPCTPLTAVLRRVI